MTSSTPHPPHYDPMQAPPEPQAPKRPHRWARPTGDVDDPWAWLRDRDDPDALAYLAAENQWADAWFGARGDDIEQVFGEIRSRIQETDMSVPVAHGPWWYVTRTEEGKNYPIHCRGASAEHAHAQVMLDENVEAGDNDYFAVNAFDVSPDHRWLAYSTDTDGSERYTLRFRDLASGTDLDDAIPNTTWGGTAWSADSSTIFYVVADEQMRPHQVWRHRVGTPVADDVQVFGDPDERFFVGVGLTRSEAWIIIESRSKQSAEAWLVPADQPDADPQVVRPRVDELEYSIDHWGDRFVITTNLDAQDFAVMTAPLGDPSDWHPFLAHQPGTRVTEVEPFGGHLLVHEWANAQPRIRVVQRDGSWRPIDLGGEPHDVEFEHNPDWTATTVRVAYQSFTTPASLYEIDVATHQRTVLKQTPVPNANLADYVATREWAVSPDGTQVPVDIVRHRTTAADGSAAGVVYGYGSYEISMAPWFSAARLSLLDRGVVWALAHPRGGGEMGRGWYLDGKLLHKRNTFDDTNAVSDHLVQTGWVAADRVAIRGGSAGGLLVGACIHLRPDRYAAAVAEVPFVDVVTTMSDPTLPLTVTEWEEWGDPRTEPWASYILGYSPYDHAVAPAQLAMYVTAGLNDPRVSFHEPAKWVARLRDLRVQQPVAAAGIGRRPLLFHCEMGAGHGGPSGRYDAWRDEAKVLVFLLHTLTAL